MGVSQRLREKSEESEGLSLLSIVGIVGINPWIRPCWYLSLARPNRSCRLRETYEKSSRGQHWLFHSL